jgi:hypothetical protein
MNTIIIKDSHGKEYQQTESGTCYHIETPERIINILESSRSWGSRIRLFYGDTKTGKSWNEENDVVGTVERSTGSIKIPLLIPRNTSMGGTAILDHCIVKIINKGSVLYQHPKFDGGKWSISESDLPEYKENALCNGEVIARFKKEGQAQRYVDFMTGKRFSR